MGLSPVEVLAELKKQGWEITRRTGHGFRLRRGDTLRNFSWGHQHRNRDQLGLTQLRMISKIFDLDPPLIKENGMPVSAATKPDVLRAMRAQDWAPRVSQASKNLEMPDAKLARLMGRDEQWVRDIKQGRRYPSKEEQDALYNIFGRNTKGVLATKWFAKDTTRPSAPPPLKPAPWVRNGSSVVEAPKPKVDPMASAVAGEQLRARGETATPQGDVVSMKDVLNAADKLGERVEEKKQPDAAAPVQPDSLAIHSEPPKGLGPHSRLVYQDMEVEEFVDKWLKPVRDLMISHVKDNERLREQNRLLLAENSKLKTENEGKKEVEAALDLMEETLRKYRPQS